MFVPDAPMPRWLRLLLQARPGDVILRRGNRFVRGLDMSERPMVASISRK